jgi:hypothetical protein
VSHRTPPAASPTDATPTGRRATFALLLLCAAGPALYAVGLLGAAALDGTPPAQTVAFDPDAPGHLAAGRLAVTAAMMLGAVALLVGAPWLAGMLAIRRVRAVRSTAAAWSLALNTLGLMAVCTLLRNTCGLSRATLLAGWLAWTAALVAAARLGAKRRGAARTFRALARRWAAALAVGAAVVAAAMLLFHREWLVQCYTGDGTEAHEIARSLKEHFLPHFEVETLGQMGTVIGAPTVVNSYWTCGLQLLLGETEAAVRLPFWIWWLGIFLVTADLATPRGTGGMPGTPEALLGKPAVAPGETPGLPDGWTLAATVAMCLLSAVWFTFYAGYYPYMADLAAPGVIEAMFTLWMLLGLSCLRRGDLAGWVVMAVLGSLVRYSGPVMFALTVGAALVWRPVPRGRMLRAAAAGCGAMAGIALFYVLWGWRDGSLWGWADTLDEELVAKFFAPTAWWRSGAWFALYFLIGCGGVAVLGLVRPFFPGNGKAKAGNAAETAWARTAASLVLAYLAIVLLSGEKKLHYLGPLLPVPLAVWLGTCFDPGPRGRRGRRLAGMTATLCFLLGIALCWPPIRPVFTLNRRLGAITRFQADSYGEACEMARLIHPMYDRGRISWFVGPHTWLGYSRLSADEPPRRPLLVTREAPPPGYDVLLDDPAWGRLCSNDPAQIEWLRTQHPPAGPQRFPWIFQPIAPRPPDRPPR